MYKKICECKVESAFFYDFGMYKCQYCGGMLTDLKRVRKIIDENTLVNIKNRKEKIKHALLKHENLLKEGLNEKNNKPEIWQIGCDVFDVKSWCRWEYYLGVLL